MHLWRRILFVFKGGRFTENEKGGGAYVAVSTLENLCDILALPVSDQMRWKWRKLHERKKVLRRKWKCVGWKTPSRTAQQLDEIKYNLSKQEWICFQLCGIIFKLKILFLNTGGRKSLQINLFLKKVKVFTFENLCDNLTFLVFNSRLSADNFGLTLKFQILQNRNHCIVSSFWFMNHGLGSEVDLYCRQSWQMDHLGTITTLFLINWLQTSRQYIVWSGNGALQRYRMLEKCVCKSLCHNRS